MMLLSSPPQPIALLPARCPTVPTSALSDRRRRCKTHHSVEAVLRARKLATLYTYPAEIDADWPAPAYVSRRRLPMAAASTTDWHTDHIIPTDGMVIEVPSKRVIALHREFHHEPPKRYRTREEIAEQVLAEQRASFAVGFRKVQELQESQRDL